MTTVPEPPWIELDYVGGGRLRYTYWSTPNEAGKYPIGCDTIIRWDWMTDGHWKREKREFFKKHPGLKPVTRSGKQVNLERDEVINPIDKERESK